MTMAAERGPEEELPPLGPEEVRARLERSAREFRNRRKVLIRGLPADVTNQEVQELLRDFELKYCYVDKHKGTALVTLSTCDEAASAVQRLHRSALRRRHHLRAQLHPGSAVLCVSNLPRRYSQQQFEALVRPYGAVERCSLVYSPGTGHSKGYGFVEYTRRSAGRWGGGVGGGLAGARARSELQGRGVPGGGVGATLWVQWCDARLLLTAHGVHARCLRVEGLPRGYGDAERLRRVFAGTCEPTFCQLALGQDGQPKGFAVVEYESAMDAERVQTSTDGALIGGSRIRVSFCTPGLPGRCVLPALIAAQDTAQSRGRGLLPDPTLLQILGGLTSPSAAPLLLAPLLHGALGGKQGLLGAAPSLPLGPGPALLQLALQNPAQKPGLLGEAPLGALPHSAVGMVTPSAAPLLGDTATGGDIPPCHPVLQSERDSPALTASLLSSARGGTAKHRHGDGTPPTAAVSLLGEPPKDFKIPLNPYLKLHSLLPPGLSGVAAPKALALQPRSVLGSVPTARISSALGEPLLPSPRAAAEGDLGSRLFPQGREHSAAPPFLGGFNHGRHKPMVLTPPDPPTPSALHSAPPKTPPTGAHKRSWSQLLPPPEPSPEGCYVGQHSQGLGGHYADSYLKRKRIF